MLLSTSNFSMSRLCQIQRDSDKSIQSFGRPTGGSQWASGNGPSLGGTLGSGAKVYFKNTVCLGVVHLQS